MEEEEKKVDTEEIKKDTVETAKQVRDAVKDTVKNVNIKNDAKEATGFVSAMFKDPFGKIKEIVNDKESKNLKLAIIFVVIWTIVVFIKALSYKYWSFNAIFKNILSLVKSIIAPALGIVVLSGIVYFMNKKEKKSLTTILTAITIAKIPVIIASVIGLITLISYNASMITSPISSICSIVTIILTYFTMKTIFNEEDNSKFLKTFVIIEAIYYVVYFVLSFLGISI